MSVLSGLSGASRTADPEWIRFGSGGSIAFILVGCVVLSAWQMQAPFDPAGLDLSYERSFGWGHYRYTTQKFFYFFYYTGKFPISTSRNIAHLRWNEQEAWRALESKRDRLPVAPRPGRAYRSPPKLIMEAMGFLRTGDYGKMFLLYPDAWMNGTPKRATLRWFNRFLGIGSLLALFVSFSLLNHRLLGSALVVVLGSNPYLMVELYAKNNIFGHMIPVASLMLALHAPLILARPRTRAVYMLPLVSGIFLASFRETRLEPALIILSVAGVYLSVPGAWRRRILLVSLLATTTVATSSFWSHYWDAKFEEAHTIVKRQKGTTFDGKFNSHHALWHSMWWGLGDFGRDKGYWNADQMAYRYGIPRVNLRFGTNYRYTPGRYTLENFYTPERKHRMKPETIPEYRIVLRDKILGDIVDDPLWYAGILAKRVQWAFNKTTPIRVAIGTRYFDIPFTAWLFLPMLAWLAYLRRWDQLKLLAFYLPTSLTTILVFGRGSMPFNAGFHMMAFAILVCWMAHAATGLRRRPAS